MSTADAPATVIVTGDSSGLGRAAEEQVGVLAVPTAVAEATAVGRLFSRASDEFGAIHGVVHADAQVPDFGHAADEIRGAIERVLPIDLPPQDAPGRFVQSAPGRVRPMLEGAGWSDIFLPRPRPADGFGLRRRRTCTR